MSTKATNNDVIEITGLGGLGDGIGHHHGKAIYIPMTLPGDQITLNPDESLKEIIKQSPHRTTPPCPHFNLCGGCSLQHMNENTYATFKQDRLKLALERSGFLNAENQKRLQPAILIGPQSRRRTDLKIAVVKNKINIGYMQRRSHDLVDITQCPILEKPLEEIIFYLKSVLKKYPVSEKLKSIALTLADVGVDIVLQSDALPTARDKKDLSDLMESIKTQPIRLSWQSGDGAAIIIQDAALYLQMTDTIKVQLPHNTFLQATQKGQALIIEKIIGALKPNDKVVDLYAGCGTFSFPAAKHGCIVTAYEGSGDMVRAAQKAIYDDTNLSRPNFQHRDLYKKPLTAQELNQFDAIIINPPRNGATPQFENIAASKVKNLIIVSCDPISLERDLKTLHGTGFNLISATPIDQFVWSEHLESVVILNRG